MAGLLALVPIASNVYGCVFAELLYCSAAEEHTLDLAAQHFVRMVFLERLRTAADRGHAEAIFAATWQLPEGELPAHAERPSMLMSRQALQLGWACLPRNKLAHTEDGEAASVGELALLPSSLHALESLAGELLPSCCRAAAAT